MAWPFSSQSRVAVRYPEWPSWLAVYREYNASGVFDSPLTDRLGISVRSGGPAGS